jgi:hypothetical protein
MSVIYLKIYRKYILEGSIEIIACKSFVRTEKIKRLRFRKHLVFVTFLVVNKKQET